MGIQICRQRLCVLLAMLLCCTAAASARTSAPQRLITIPNFSDGGLVTGSRTIRVYLPEDYARTKKRYRVLYFHDGQEIFSSQTTRSGDKCAYVNIAYDQLVARGRIYPAILVGVDAGPNDGRVQELTPTQDAESKTGGKADAYYTFLVTRVKSYIDAHYRTLPDAKHTGVVGWSLGGLASFYLAYKHPETFGFAGCMSSSLWWDAKKLLKQVQGDAHSHTDTRFWFDCGTGEGRSMWQPAVLAVRALEKKGWREGDDLALFLDYAGQHAQASWATRMPFMLQFLLGKHRPKLTGAVIRQVANASSSPIRLLDGDEELYATLELQYDNGFRLNAAAPQLRLDDSRVAEVDSAKWGLLTNKGPGTTTLRADWQGKRKLSAVQTVIGFGAADLPQYDRLPCPETSVATQHDEPLGSWEQIPFTTPNAVNQWRFAVARDATRNLHIRVEVTAQHIQADATKDPWQQDGIEVRLDARPDPWRFNGQGQGEFRQLLLLAASPSGGRTGVYGKDNLPPQTFLSCDQTTTGYALEATVPAEWLDRQQKEPWTEFRLNICVNRPNATGTDVVKQWWQPDWRSADNKAGSGTFRCKS